MGDLEWMAWTPATLAFVAGIVAALGGLAVGGALWPSAPRKGFLPIPTARGDRVYVGLLGVGLIFICQIAFTTAPLTFGVGLAVAWMAVVLRWG